MMPNESRHWANWSVVAVFAAGMAWVESAVVFYLRTLIDRIEPYQPEPLPMVGALGAVELAREAATLIMLLAVGILAGRTWRARFGYAAIAFGAWDILYYVFLKIMCGWPHSLLDWDILFLLPLPWWGPVLAPLLIALLLVVWGTLATRFPDRAPGKSARVCWALAAVGAGLALYTFMADALRVAPNGVAALQTMLPERFNWPAFSLALLLMSAPVVRLVHAMTTPQALTSRNAVTR